MSSNNVSDVSLCGIYSDGQPGDPLVLDGSMDGTATSENPMHYDWYKVVNPIPIHTSINDGVATIIDALILADDADYRLDAWNICGHYPPMNFHVYVGDGPPIPTAGLGSVYGCIGYDATFDMNPSKWELKHPIQEVTYTLRYDPQGILQVDLQTNTTGIFSVMDAWNQYNSDNGYPPLTGGLTSAQAGEYVIYAMNGCGANIDLSSGAHLYVIDGTTTASVSLDQPEVCSKTTVNFTATSDGDSHDKTYQWKYEGSDIVGATNSTLTFETDATHSDYTRGGHYSVFVQNYCGAGTTSDEVLLTVNALPLATVSHGSLSFCNGGSVELRADGGTSWLWSPTGEISQSITVTTSGTYSVVVTGDHGCTNTSTDMLVTVWDLPVATVAVTDPLCEGDNGNVEISATGGSGTYVSGTGSHTVLAGDPYSFTVTDGNGCTSNVISGTMYAPTAIVASVVVTDPLCEGGNGTVEVSAIGGTGTYPTGTGSHTVAAGDAYSFTVTDGNGCTSNVISGTMFAPTAVVATAVVTNPLCEGGNGTVEVSATGGTGTYPTGTGSHSVLAGDAYNFTVTDGNGCPSNVISGTMYAPTPVVATAVVTNPLCEGGNGTVIVSATGGTGTYVSGTGSHTVKAGDAYSFTVTDGNGCTSNVISGTMFAPTAVSAHIGTQGTIMCNGESTTFSVVASGGTSPYTYTIGTETNSTGVFTRSAGSYSVEVLDKNLCTPAYVPVTLNEPTTLSAFATPGTISCYHETASVVVTASGGYGSYSGTGTFDRSTGTYSFTVTDGHGCTATATCHLDDAAQVTVSGSESFSKTTGTGQSVTFTPSISGPSPLHYQWSKGGTVLSGKTSSTLVISSIVCDDAGTYSISVWSGSCHSTATGYSGTLTVGNPAIDAATGIGFGTWTKSSIKFSVTTQAGNRLIVAKLCSLGTSSNTAAIQQLTWTPTNGQTYAASNTFGTYTNADVSIIYNGTGITDYWVYGLTTVRYYAIGVFNYASDGCVNPYYSNGLVKAQKTIKESDDEPFALQVAENFMMTDIAPNPAYSDINFKIMTQEKLPFIFEIYSIEGMQVYTEQMDVDAGTTPVTISLKSEKGTLPSGMYILKVRTGNDEMTRRFIYIP